MMTTTISRDQAYALAALVRTLRPDWEERGTVKAISDARTMGTPAEVCIATIKAANVTTNRTPAVIAMPGKHWQHEPAPTTPDAAWYGPPDRNSRRCTEHTIHPLPCSACRSEWLAGMRDKPEPITEKRTA